MRRRDAIATDLERIEAGRRTAGRLAVLMGAAIDAGPEFYIDSVGGITWHDRDSDPRTNAALAAIPGPANLQLAQGAAGPAAERDALAPPLALFDRLAPRPWR